MKAKRDRGPARAARSPRRPWGRARRLGIALLLIPIGAASWWLSHRRFVPPPVTTSDPARDSIAVLDPWPSYQRALALKNGNRFAESLPYFQHALATPPDRWEPYYIYGSSMNNAIYQGRTVAGISIPVSRSSFERVLMMRDATLQFEIAERLAPTAADQAYVISARAQQLAAWGMTWNAVSEYARAAIGHPDERLKVTAYLDRLRDPVANGAAPAAEK